MLLSSLFTYTPTSFYSNDQTLFRNKPFSFSLSVIPRTSQELDWFCHSCLRFRVFCLNGSSNSHPRSLHLRCQPQPQRIIPLRHSSSSISELRIPDPNIPALPSWPATTFTHPRVIGDSRAGTRLPSDYGCPPGAEGLPELPHTAEVGWFRRRRRGALVRLLCMQTLSLSLSLSLST